MDIDDQWTRQQAGIECYLCPPQLLTKKDTCKIASLSISDLYLLPDQRFPGNSALIFNAHHAIRLDWLTDDEYTRFAGDLRLCVRAICAALQPDHMNLALLGNSCPHLHWGIAPRFRNDPCWGKPIWGGTAAMNQVPPATLTELADAELISNIRTHIQSAIASSGVIR